MLRPWSSSIDLFSRSESVLFESSRQPSARRRVRISVRVIYLFIYLFITRAGRHRVLKWVRFVCLFVCFLSFWFYRFCTLDADWFAAWWHILCCFTHYLMVLDIPSSWEWCWLLSTTTCICPEEQRWQKMEKSVASSWKFSKGTQR